MSDLADKIEDLCRKAHPSTVTEYTCINLAVIVRNNSAEILSALRARPAVNETEAALLKAYCVAFYRWWHNQPGSNTEQGYDAWVKSEHALPMLLRAARPAGDVEVGELREALAPFAREANNYEAFAENSALTTDVAGRLSVRDLRRARAAYSVISVQSGSITETKP
jgi:hypothetical protein